jgi:hypothetical protein
MATAGGLVSTLTPAAARPQACPTYSDMILRAHTPAFTPHTQHNIQHPQQAEDLKQ